LSKLLEAEKNLKKLANEIEEEALEEPDWMILPRYILTATMFQTMFFRSMICLERLSKKKSVVRKQEADEQEEDHEEEE